MTGLIWEVKTASGLRSSSHTYTWYSTDTASNGGVAGVAGTNTCGGTLSAAPYNNQCNTQNFVVAVNATGLCGAANWRLPTRKELMTLVHVDNSPAIDGTYFPSSVATGYWARNSMVARPGWAWGVAKGRTSGFWDKLTDLNAARLVRA